MNFIKTALGAALFLIPAASTIAQVKPAEPAAAVTASPAAAPVPEKLICRSTIETGSLVKKRRSCLTRKQWSYVDDAQRDEARHMVQDNTSRPNGN